MIGTDEFGDGERDLGVARQIKEMTDNGVFRAVGFEYCLSIVGRDVAHMAVGRVYFRRNAPPYTSPVVTCLSLRLCTAARSANNKRSSSGIRENSSSPQQFG